MAKDSEYVMWGVVAVFVIIVYSLTKTTAT